MVPIVALLTDLMREKGFCISLFAELSIMLQHFRVESIVKREKKKSEKFLSFSRT